MREIQIKDAEGHLSEVVDEAIAGEPAILTRRGKKEAVIISFDDWETLSGKRSWGWYLTHAPIEDGDLPERQSGGWREFETE